MLRCGALLLAVICLLQVESQMAKVIPANCPTDYTTWDKDCCEQETKLIQEQHAKEEANGFIVEGAQYYGFENGTCVILSTFETGSGLSAFDYFTKEQCEAKTPYCSFDEPLCGCVGSIREGTKTFRRLTYSLYKPAPPGTF